MYNSETSIVRHLVLPYCIGYGCDIAAAGDKIVKENCDFIGDPNGYANCGNDPINIPCHINMENPLNSIPVENNKYDYVYSSHLIEDFSPTLPILEEHARILKENGNLILVFPDQAVYEEHCKRNNSIPNGSHKIKEISLTYMLNQIKKSTHSYEILFTSDCEISYNVIIVAKKIKVKKIIL